MGSDDRTVRVFEVPSGRELLAFGTWFSLSDKVLSVAFSSDGAHLAALTTGVGMSLYWPPVVVLRTP
jgi:WD40 repeat protein